MSVPVPSLDEVLQLVVVGCRGDGDVATRIRAFIQGTMLIPFAPPAFRALGDGLIRLLDGKRDEEATAGLPKDVADLVKVLQRRIEAPPNEGV